MKEQAEGRLDRYYQDEVEVIQAVWNSRCSRCTAGVFLKKVAWSVWHSLRASWWGYHYWHIDVGRRGDGEGRVRVYRFLGIHRKKWHENVWVGRGEVGCIDFESGEILQCDQVISGSVKYLVETVEKIYHCGYDIISNSLGWTKIKFFVCGGMG